MTMTKKQFFTALKKATNGTFELPGVTTLMGWFPRYDKKGRPLNADPNYIHYYVNIDGINYAVTKHGWNVIVWKSEYIDEVSYCSAMGDTKDNNKILYEYDITPKYLKNSTI